jgi:hypothetical protein
LTQKRPDRDQRREQTNPEPDLLGFDRPLDLLRRQQVTKRLRIAVDQILPDALNLAPQPSLATMANHKASLLGCGVTTLIFASEAFLSILNFCRELSLREVPFVLAAILLTANFPKDQIVVATSKIGHLSRFVPAEAWQKIRA